MNSIKAALLSMILGMACTSALANDDHAPPKAAAAQKDAHAAVEKPEKAEPNADAAAKTVPRKRVARASKKAAPAAKEEAAKDSGHDSGHDAHAAPAPAAPPVIAKRVQVRDRTTLAKSVNAANPISKPAAGAMFDSAPAAAHDDHSALDLSLPGARADRADQVATHSVDSPKAEQSSYSLIDRHPAEYARPISDANEHASEPVRSANADSVRPVENASHAAEPVRQVSAPAAPAQADAGGTCNPPTKAEIAALFDRWNRSLRTGDPKKVVANYAPYSVLLPTVSNKARFTPAEKEDYFQHFLERRPDGRIDDRLIEVDCRTASDAGLYTFRFGDGSMVKARYSFTYKKIGDEWLISSHHSSGMPEKPEPPKVAVHEKPAAKPVEREELRTETPTRAQGWVRYP